ncbi:hypothetical protein NRK68_36535 (plasmid) [Streptomyces yangpuensis]|uniref:Uncharacterized protein n=1 Tax=Streptomyces yangpuensis TaxID=1648182 RepID=A0ABY5Q9B0_9ACTN|nr:hypothetical protein [Streptomyces yangpuensis]UUY52765.1 hypothetical protein NRK68_36535 [Streptomyces yangpuensis]
MTRNDTNVWVGEDDDHHLLGREVIHPGTERTGTVGTVFIRTSKVTGKPVGRTAHMRPMDGSGREWTADPPRAETPAPARPGRGRGRPVTGPRAWVGDQVKDAGRRAERIANP